MKSPTSNSNLFDQVPPNNAGYEDQCLSALLDETPTGAVGRGDAINMLNASDFYHVLNAVIFSIIKKAWDDNSPFDLHSVFNAYNESSPTAEESERFLDHLTYIFEIHALAINAGLAAAKVKQYSRARMLANSAIELARLCYESPTEKEEIDEAAECLNVQAFKETAVGQFDFDIEFAKVADRLFADTDDTIKCKSGIFAIDEQLIGFRAGQLIILAARPSVGKTALATTIADYAAGQGKHVVLFSCEMPREALAARVLSMRAKVPLWRMRNNMYSEEEVERCKAVANELDTNGYGQRFRIHDLSSPNFSTIRSLSRNALLEMESVDLIVVDYLQLISGTGQNREQEVASVSRGLKGLALELECPVLALSQLNRQAESEFPRMKHLRESGAIEQDADVIMLMHREEMKDRADTNWLPDPTTLIGIEKHRDGPCGRVEIAFDHEFLMFTNKGETTAEKGFV